MGFNASPSGAGRRNPKWQRYYDSLWYFYVMYYGQSEPVKRKVSGRENARNLAQSLSYHPGVDSITVYTSKRSVKNGIPKRFVFKRTLGWK